jgi:hypothetical protein
MSRIIRLLLYISMLFAADPVKILSTYNIEYMGNIECKIDTLLIVEYGDKYNQIVAPELEIGSVHSGPHQFDSDDSSLYFFDDYYLYKFNFYTDSLVWRKSHNYFVIDFKYFKKQIYIYHKTTLSIYDAATGDSLKAISLEPLDYNKSSRFNACFFFDKYFALADLNIPYSFKSELKYLYDMEKDTFLDQRNGEIIDYYPVTNCQNCDLKFRMDLFDARTLIGFLGQSKNFLLFDLLCHKTINPNCPEDELSHFLIYKKSDNSYCIITNDFQSDGSKFSYIVCFGSVKIEQS